MRPFSVQRRRERDAADRLYSACAAAARRSDLFTGLGVPDTLQGRFEMLTLHLFPILHRLMHDPGDDPALARGIAESFVSDMDAAFRELGVGDVTVPKRMSTLYRSFGGRIAAYKQALETGQRELASAIMRNVFPAADPNRSESGPDRRASALGAYVDLTIGAIRSADLARLQRGDVQFPDLPQDKTAAQ